MVFRRSKGNSRRSTPFNHNRSKAISRRIALVSLWTQGQFVHVHRLRPIHHPKWRFSPSPLSLRLHQASGILRGTRVYAITVRARLSDQLDDTHEVLVTNNWRKVEREGDDLLESAGLPSLEKYIHKDTLPLKMLREGLENLRYEEVVKTLAL
jgi:hypothetical protein